MVPQVKKIGRICLSISISVTQEYNFWQLIEKSNFFYFTCTFLLRKIK